MIVPLEYLKSEEFFNKIGKIIYNNIWNELDVCIWEVVHENIEAEYKKIISSEVQDKTLDFPKNIYDDLSYRCLIFPNIIKKICKKHDFLPSLDNQSSLELIENAIRYEVIDSIIRALIYDGIITCKLFIKESGKLFEIRKEIWLSEKQSSKYQIKNSTFQDDELSGYIIVHEKELNKVEGFLKEKGIKKPEENSKKETRGRKPKDETDVLLKIWEIMKKEDSINVKAREELPLKTKLRDQVLHEIKDFDSKNKIGKTNIDKLISKIWDLYPNNTKK